MKRTTIIAAIAAALCVSAQAQELMLRQVANAKTNTFVEVTSMFGKLPATGYAPVQVKIANRSGSNRSISLNFRSTDGFYGRNGSEMRSDFTLSAEAGRTEVIDLLVPMATALNATHGGQTSLRVELAGDLGSSQGSMSSSLQSGLPTILLSQPLHTPNASTLDAETAKRHSSSWGGLTFAGKFTPGMMPDDWRAYAGFDLMMLTDNDWSSLPAGARGAILSWIRLGGRLVVYSTSQSSTLASLGLGDEEKRSFGRIEIRPIDKKLALDAPKTLNLAIKAGSFRPHLDNG